MILGAIIAGGQSRRFGSDKALVLVSGVPMIERVAASLRPVVDTVAVCGRGYGNLVALPDRPAAGLGPLGGLAAALHYAETHGYMRVITAPCDTPTLTPGLLDELGCAGEPAFLADCPVIGIWPAQLSRQLDEFVATDPRRSVGAWARSIGAIPLYLPAPVNVNRPADLALVDG